MPERDADSGSSSSEAVLIALLIGFLAAATPPALYVWWVLSEALAGETDPVSLLRAVLLLVPLVAATIALGRRLQRLEHAPSRGSSR